MDTLAARPSNSLDGTIGRPRPQPDPVLVADAIKTFSGYTVRHAVYGTGWDGDVTVSANANGELRVDTGFVDFAPTPMGFFPRDQRREGDPSGGLMCSIGGLASDACLAAHGGPIDLEWHRSSCSFCGLGGRL
jgi:hypothetical protein